MTDHYKETLDELAHEIWAVAQLAPGEGIVDGVDRIVALLRKVPHPAIIHCDGCGCDWLDNGLNPIGCPYCELGRETERELKERDALREALKELVNWFPSADTYLRLGFDPKAPMQALKEAKVVLSKETSNDCPLYTPTGGE